MLYYVDTPMDKMRVRTAQRTIHPGTDSFEISEELFESYVKYWEPPAADEQYTLAA